jgi:hypothetical protein
MAHPIMRGKNGRRYEVDLGDSPIRVEIHASEETVEIFVEADFETALINIPRPQQKEIGSRLSDMSGQAFCKSLMMSANDHYP